MRRYTPYIIIIFATLTFCWKLGFTNLVLARGDTLLYIYPYWAYRSASLLSGEIPLWNPYIFMGAPFLANPQSAVLYPFNWPLAFLAPHVAIKPAIILHFAIAGLGSYALAKRTLKVSTTAATLSAITFAFGGHLTAKVEQVNQMQAMAWMPCLLWVTAELLTSTRYRRRWGLLFSVFLAVQMLAGHPQTSFISITGIIIWASLTKGAIQNTASLTTFYKLRILLQHLAKRFASLIPYVALGTLITSAQLLPTFELARHSLRSGGMTIHDTISFSLHPLLLGRSLLPPYSQALSNEYVSHIGVIALLLAILGLTCVQTKGRIPLIVMTSVALLLATGGYTPIYSMLAKLIPGFDLFRAPARWLAMWSLGAALLAGLGCDALANLSHEKRRHMFWVFLATTSMLVSLTILSARIVAPGDSGPLGLPTLPDLAGWVLALTVALLFTMALGNKRALIVLAVAVELFIASIKLPINNLTTPEAYTSLRPSITHLLSTKHSTLPSDRTLSMSRLVYDPGDLSYMTELLERQIPSEAVETAIVATKAKEVLSPNLSMIWKIPSVDGYGGGILPIQSYAQFTAHFTSNTPSIDGRLRQNIKHVPANWLLNITNTRWLITDKLSDIWRNNIFYDLQFDVNLNDGEQTQIERLRPIQTTTVGIMLSADAEYNDRIADLYLTQSDGSFITRPIISPGKERSLVQIDLATPMTPHSVIVKSLIPHLTIHGLTLIDMRTGAYQPQTLGHFNLVDSGDIKIYDNLGVFPRAYQVNSLPISDTTSTTGVTDITAYTANRVLIETYSKEPTILILADAHYPGWKAKLDGIPANIDTANGFFRAVAVPAGTHHIEFRYEPSSWIWGLRLTSFGIASWILLALFTIFPKPHS